MKIFITGDNPSLQTIPKLNVNGKLESNNYTAFVDSIVHKNIVVIGPMNSYVEDLINKFAQNVKLLDNISYISEPVEQLPFLYYINGSISSRRILMFLYEHGIKFDCFRLKIMRSEPETRTNEFLAINPRGKAPVLDYYGEIIYESIAILLYLARKKNLLNDDFGLTVQRMIESENLIKCYEEYEEIIFAKREDVSGGLDRVIANINSELLIWDVYLSQTKYLVGNTFGIADLAFFPILDHMMHRRYPFVFSLFKNVGEYYSEICNRTSSIKSRPTHWKY